MSKLTTHAVQGKHPRATAALESSSLSSCPEPYSPAGALVECTGWGRVRGGLGGKDGQQAAALTILGLGTHSKKKALTCYHVMGLHQHLGSLEPSELGSLEPFFPPGLLFLISGFLGSGCLGGIARLASALSSCQPSYDGSLNCQLETESLGWLPSH